MSPEAKAYLTSILSDDSTEIEITQAFINLQKDFLNDFNYVNGYLTKVFERSFEYYSSTVDRCSFEVVFLLRS